MGQKGGSNQTSTTQSASSPPPQVMADYQALVNRATNTANTPYEQYSGEEVAPLSNQTVQGLGGINSYANSAQPFYGAAAGATMAAANPIQAQQYSDSAINQYQSPYTQDVVNSTQNQFNNQNQQASQFLNSQNISSGAFGGDRAGVSQSILANQQQSAQAPVIAGLYNTAYNNAQNEFNTQQGVDLQSQAFNQQQLGQMANQLSGIGTASQSAGLQGSMAQIQGGEITQQEQQAIDTALYNQYQQQQSYPFQSTGWLGNLIEGTGSLSGGTSSSQTSTPVGSGASSAVGAATSGLGILGSLASLSDERVKENITPVGETFDHQTIYRYNFKGDPRTQIGLIAQETQHHHPEAVGQHRSGLKMVDYDAATRNAAHRGHFAFGGAAQGLGLARPHFDGGGPIVDLTNEPTELNDPFGLKTLNPAAGESNNIYNQITQNTDSPAYSVDQGIVDAIGGQKGFTKNLATPYIQDPGPTQHYPAIDWQQPGNDFQTAGAEASLQGLINRPGIETTPTESNPAPASIPAWAGSGGGGGPAGGGAAATPATLAKLGIAGNNAFAQGGNDSLINAIAGGGSRRRGGRIGRADGGGLNLSAMPFGGDPYSPQVQTATPPAATSPVAKAGMTQAPAAGHSGPSTLQELYGSAPGASAMNPSGNGALMADNWGAFMGPSGAIAQDAALHGQPTGGNALMNPGSFNDGSDHSALTDAIATGQGQGNFLARGGVARALRNSGGMIGQTGMASALQQPPQGSMINNGGGFSSMFGNDPGKGGISRPTFAQGGQSSDPAIGANPWETNGAGWVPIVNDPVSGHGPPEPQGAKGGGAGGGGAAAQQGSPSLQSGIKELGDLAKKTGILGGSPTTGAAAPQADAAVQAGTAPDTSAWDTSALDDLGDPSTGGDVAGGALSGAAADDFDFGSDFSGADFSGFFASGGKVRRRHFDVGGDVPEDPIDPGYVSESATPVDPSLSVTKNDPEVGGVIDPAVVDKQFPVHPASLNGGAREAPIDPADAPLPPSRQKNLIGSAAPAIPPPRPNDATLGGKTPSLPSPATPAVPSSIKVGQALAPQAGPAIGAVGPQTGNARGAPVSLGPQGGPLATAGQIGGGPSAAPQPARQALGAIAPGAPQAGRVPVGTTGALAPAGAAGGGDVKSMVFNTFRKLGVPPQAALGAMYSLAGESGAGLNPNAFNPKDPGGSFGIGQWNGPRRAALNAYAQSQGLSPSDPRAQVGYLAQELSNPRSPTYQPGVLAALQGAPDARTATNIWTSKFERPTVNNSAARYALGAQTIGTLDQNGNIVGGGRSRALTGPPDASGASDLGAIASGGGAAAPNPAQAAVANLKGSDGQPFFQPSDQSNPFSNKRELFNAMMYAGFAMMGGESRNPWVNIGRGAMAGQEYMQKQSQLDRDWVEKQAQIQHLSNEDRRGDADLALRTQQQMIVWQKFKAGMDMAKSVSDYDKNFDSGGGGATGAETPAAAAPASGAAPSAVAPIDKPGSATPAAGGSLKITDANPDALTSHAYPAPGEKSGADIPGAAPAGGPQQPAGGPSGAAAAPGPAQAAEALPAPSDPKQKAAADAIAKATAKGPYANVVKEDNPNYWSGLAALYSRQAGLDPEAGKKAMEARVMAAKVANAKTMTLTDGSVVNRPGAAQASGEITGAEEAARVNARRGEPFDGFIQGTDGSWTKQRFIDPSQIKDYAATGTVGGRPVRTDEPPALQGQAAGAKETATQQAQVNPDIAAGRANIKGEETMAEGTAKQVLEEDQTAGNQSVGLNQQNQRLDAMKEIMTHWQPGGIAENLAEIRNVARSFGIPVKDPSSAYEFMKNSVGEVFDALKEQKGQVRNMEITGLSKSNPSINIPSEANAEMIAQLQGVIKQRQDYYQAYSDWRAGPGKNGDQSPALFARGWQAKHDIGDYVKAAKHDIAYQGQVIPPPAKREVGQLYMAPDGSGQRFRWGGQSGWQPVQ